MCMQTCCDIAIIDILFKITNLPHYIEQQSDRTFELEHFTIQAQIVFRAFGICPHFMRWPLRIPVEFWVFVAFDGVFEATLHQITASNYEMK